MVHTRSVLAPVVVVFALAVLGDATVPGRAEPREAGPRESAPKTSLSIPARVQSAQTDASAQPSIVRLSKDNAFAARDASPKEVEAYFEGLTSKRTPVMPSAQDPKNTGLAAGVSAGAALSPVPRDQWQRDQLDAQAALDLDALPKLSPALGTLTLSPKNPTAAPSSLLQARLLFIYPTKLDTVNSFAEFVMDQEPGPRPIGEVHQIVSGPHCSLAILAKKTATYVITIDRNLAGQKGNLAVTLIKNGYFGPYVYEIVALELPPPVNGLSKFVVSTQGADPYDGYYTLGLRSTHQGDIWKLKSLTIKQVK